MSQIDVVEPRTSTDQELEVLSLAHDLGGDLHTAAEDEDLPVADQPQELVGRRVDLLNDIVVVAELLQRVWEQLGHHEDLHPAAGWLPAQSHLVVEVVASRVVVEVATEPGRD